MMVIDVRKLNAQKKYSGRMEFEYSAPQELIGIPYVNFVAPVKISFDYELFEDDSLEIRGNVAFVLEGQCSRCLQSARNEVTGEIEAYFQPCKNGEDYAYSNGIVDLKRAVDDAIMACMPYTLSCGDDCKGLTYTD